MAEFPEKDLQRRLSLYQVFLKLYEHHGSLLDEILQLENLSQPSLRGVQPRYVQGVVDSSIVYVISNLCEGKTQSLRQPQQIWTMGRDRTCGIHIADKHVSRRHAAIQYIDEKGFYLIDFSSTNGTFVNGEPVYQPIKLQDGDRIRLGNISFSFFVNLASPQVLPRVAVELLMQLVPRKNGDEVEIPSYSLARKKYQPENLDSTVQVFRDLDLIGSEPLEIATFEPSLTKQRQSEILDEFFRRQVTDNG